MIVIPLPKTIEGDFSQRTRLEGVDYRLSFSHNSRTDSWSLGMAAIGGADQEPVPIVTGKKVFIGGDLLRYSQHPLRPPGKLFALALDGNRQAPKFAELGVRVRLYYLLEAETF